MRCRQCGAEFEPRRPSHVYCCKQCRMEANRQRKGSIEARMMERAEISARQAVAALDEDTRTGLALLLECAGRGYSIELLDEFYSQPMLSDVLREMGE